MELPGIPTLSERREVVRPGAGLPLRPKNRVSEVTMGHWQSCREVAEGYDQVVSIIYARDHLEALLRAKPELEPKLDPIIGQLNELILGAEKVA